MSEQRAPLSQPADERLIKYLSGGLLLGAAILLSGRYACAAPFAALAALAALSTDIRSGVVIAAGVWFANQAVGFAFLDYPLDSSCALSGAVLGLSTLVSFFAARFAFAGFQRAHVFVQAAKALLFAFAAFQASLYAGMLATASGEAALSWLVIAQMASLNAAWFAVLFCLDRALLRVRALRHRMQDRAAADASKPQAV